MVTVYDIMQKYFIVNGEGAKFVGLLRILKDEETGQAYATFWNHADNTYTIVHYEIARKWVLDGAWQSYQGS